MRTNQTPIGLNIAFEYGKADKPSKPRENVQTLLNRLVCSRYLDVSIATIVVSELINFFFQVAIHRVENYDRRLGIKV